MKEKFCSLPKTMREQILVRSAAGTAFLLLSVLTGIWFRDIYLSLPCILLAGYLFFQGGSLLYAGYRGGYICIRSTCEETESCGRRRRIRSVRVSFDGQSLKIPVSRGMKRIAAGDTVIIYLSDRTPVYEWENGYMICSYYAIAVEKRCVQDDGGRKKAEVTAEGN